MTDIPTPPNPVKGVKGAAKGLGGKLKNLPPWAYVAGVVLIIGVAIMFRRGNSGNTTAPVADSTTGGFTGDTSTFPDASQGAFGGFSDPAVNSSTDGTNDGTNPQPPASINIYVPGPTSEGGGGIPAATATGSSSVTGGGTVPARNVTAQHAAPAQATGIATLVRAPTTSAPAVYRNTDAGNPRQGQTFRLVYENVTTGSGKKKKTVRHAVHVYPDGHRVDMGPA